MPAKTEAANSAVAMMTQIISVIAGKKYETYLVPVVLCSSWCSRWSTGRLSNWAACLGAICSWFSVTLRNPIFWPTLYTKNVETMTINKNGAHQLALRRRSVNVFEGAMKVLTMRAPWESGAVSDVDADKGESGAAAMLWPPGEREGILAGSRRKKQANPGAAAHVEADAFVRPASEASAWQPFARSPPPRTNASGATCS